MDSFVYHGEVSVDLHNSARGEVLVVIAFPSAKIRVVVVENGLLLLARAYFEANGGVRTTCERSG